ncbi:MAG: zinc ribbon domain-containing protein [Deltaproteobacteria bacterium]|nr:zinc ribbon domain-containing protein [Deltaproteobacteria bacterium]
MSELIKQKDLEIKANVQKDRNITVITGCPSCGFDQLDDDYKFCSICKHDLRPFQTQCEGCGYSRLIMSKGQKFCPRCTKPVQELQS